MDDNSYRHAFLVLEQRTPTTALDNGAAGSAQLVRHVLCAESDVDRDLWVDALVKSIAGVDNGGKQGAETKDPFVDVQSMATSPASPSYPPSSFPSQPLVAPQTAGTASVASPTGAQPPLSPGGLVRPKRSGSLSRRFRGNSGNVVLSEQDLANSGPPPSMQVSSPSLGSMALPEVGRSSYPQRATSPDQGSSALGHDGMPTTPQGRTIKLPISGPMNGQPIPPGYKFGGKDEVGSSDGHGKRDDKRRFWQGLRPFGGEKSGKHEQRPVFGVPLADSVAVSSVGEGTGLPSVVYRCIEYLERRNASMEEGIYRLSGSSAVIKSLKDKFNAEGDVDLLSGDQYYDPHAIAGLLKTFLRELPSSVLTRELHLDFMRVNGESGAPE
jgi:RalA-binding protein 1